jgi:putative restriction endonuclease
LSPDARDLELRQGAVEAVRRLSERYDDIIPVQVLRNGFSFRGERISFGSFYSGIYRPRQCHGPAALTITTTPPKASREAPYDDGFDPETGRFRYHYRRPRSDTPAARLAAAADNRALRAAYDLAVPLIYFSGVAPGQYTPVAPMFIVRDDPAAQVVYGDAALPVADMTEAGLVSAEAVREYATREAVYRLHQRRFRINVLRAYSTRCAVCALREAPLLQAAHIVEDRDSRGSAAVVNGIALCAIHHLAYDRNLMGIDPDGVVHIARRVLEEDDGPMLTTGLQGFHRQPIRQPRRPDERPRRDLLEIRYESFRAA